MKIEINSKHQIVTDSLNVILQEKHICQEGKNKGREYWENLGCYANLEQAYKACVEHDIMDDAELTGVNQIIDKLNNIHKDVKKSIAGIRVS